MSLFSTNSTPSTVSKASLLRGDFSASNMAGKGGILVRKLLRGDMLTRAEQDIVASTGLGGAVADLVGSATAAPQGYMAGAKNGADVALKVRNVEQAANQADKVWAQNHAGYARVSDSYHHSAVAKGLNATESTQQKIFNTAGDVATVAGLGLSAVALPNMAEKTVSSFKELTHLIHDPSANNNQRLDAAEQMARAGAGTIFSAQGVYLGVKGTTAILSRSKTLASVFNGLSNSKFLTFMKYNPIGKVLGALLPIADGAVFIGEGIATRRTFENPQATTGQKIHQALNFGLAGVKVAFWIFPETAFLKRAYNLANFGQLGLAIYDFQKTMRPKLISAAKTTLWGVTHPVQGFHAAVGATGRAVSSAFHKAGSALAWLGSKVLHPGQTISNATTEVKTWNAAFVQATGRTISSYLPHGTQQAPVAPAPASTTLAPAPAPATVAPAPAPVAPAPAPVAPAPAPVAPAPAPVVTTVPAVAPSQQTQTGAVPTPVTTAPTVDTAYQAALSQIAPATTQP